MCDCLPMLGVSVASDLSWNEHICSVTKSEARKIGFLFRSKRFFTPLNLSTLYKAQIRACREYGLHLWRRAPKHSLATLDAIQKRAVRLIENSTLTDSLDSLAHRRNVSALSLFYRYYHSRWSDELKSVIHSKACFASSTRFSDSQHSFEVKLEKCRTTSFANTLVPMTSRNWNSLPASIFPRTYNLQTFKSECTNTYPCILSLDQLSLLFGNARVFQES